MFLQTVVTGLSIGGIYALMAVGYSLVFSVLSFSNFAHGAVIMLGAYIGLGLVTKLHFGLGLVVAGFFALQQVARSSHVDEEAVVLDPEGHDAEETALLSEHIVAYRLEGSLFFGAAHAFLLELSEVSDVRVVILRMSRVVSLDATGASVLADTIARLEGRHITVLLSGIRPEHEQVLSRLGVYDELAHERHVFATTPAAIEHARAHAQRRQHAPGES